VCVCVCARASMCDLYFVSLVHDVHCISARTTSDMLPLTSATATREPCGHTARRTHPRARARDYTSTCTHIHMYMDDTYSSKTQCTRARLCCKHAHAKYDFVRLGLHKHPHANEARARLNGPSEPTSAERVAYDAEIPDRASYRYDTSSESFSPPFWPLLRSPIHRTTRAYRAIYTLRSFCYYLTAYVYIRTHISPTPPSLLPLIGF